MRQSARDGCSWARSVEQSTPASFLSRLASVWRGVFSGGRQSAFSCFCWGAQLGGAARELSSSLEERVVDPSEGHLLSFPHPSLKRQNERLAGNASRMKRREEHVRMRVIYFLR